MARGPEDGSAPQPLPAPKAPGAFLPGTEGPGFGVSRRRDRGDNIPQLVLPVAFTLVLHGPGINHDLFAVTRVFARSCVPALLLNPCVWQVGMGTPFVGHAEVGRGWTGWLLAGVTNSSFGCRACSGNSHYYG